MGRQGAKSFASREELESFQKYLFEMSDVLEALVVDAQLSGIALDFSLESLHGLEEYLVAGSSREEEQVALRKSRAARYLGEVFRRNIGGHWELCLKEPGYLYNKLPVVAGYATVPIEFCPIEMVANFLHSRDRGFLMRVVQADKQWVKGS